MHRYLGRSHETTFETGHFEQRETSLQSDTQNLEGTALKCVVAKKEEERDSADKIFEILLN